MAVISRKGEIKLLQATYELHNMALEAVDLVVNNDELLDLFYVNRDLWPAIKESWNKKQMDFQGRFDFAWDGKGEPKLLEYNADTPSLQIESGKLSESWFRSFKYSDSKYRNYYESNWLHEAFRYAAMNI